MTAFYMFRLMGKTFYGESHVDPHVEPKIHESPRSMTVPLILLAIPSVVVGRRPGPAVRRLRPSATGWSRSSIPPRRRMGIARTRRSSSSASTAC